MKLRKINKLSPRAVAKHFQSQHEMAHCLGLTQQAVSKQVRLWDTQARPMPYLHHKTVAAALPDRYRYIDGQLYAVLAA